MIEPEARSNEAWMEAKARPDEAAVEARTNKTAIEATLEATTPKSATTPPATLSRGGG